MPRAPTTPKPPRRPAWSIWKHHEGGIFFNRPILNGLEEVDPTNFRFTTTLKYVGCVIGGSSVNFCFQDLEHATGARFVMLPREFDKVITQTTLPAGLLRALSRFEKHGTTIAAYLVKELLDDGEEDSETEQFI